MAVGEFPYVKKPSHPSLLSIPVVAPAVSDEKCGSFSDAKELFRSHSSVRSFVRDEDDDEVILAGERDGLTERLLKSHFSETKNILNCSKCGAGGDRDGEEEDSKTEDAVTMCVCTHGWA